MTLKEKMLEILPEDVSDVYKGGVKLCPSSYSFLEGHFKINADDACVRVCDDDCKKCWSQPYIENVDKDTNVPTKNIKVGTKWRYEEEDVTLIITNIDGNNVKYEYNQSFIGSMPKEYLLKHYKCIDDTDINVGNISNNVNHPKHYQGKHECIDIMIAMFGKQAVIDFCKCNILKYRWRADKKNGEEDIKKAEWYETKLLELEGE